MINNMMYTSFFLIKQSTKNQALGKKSLKALLTAGKTELAGYAGFEEAVFLCQLQDLLSGSNYFTRGVLFFLGMLP